MSRRQARAQRAAVVASKRAPEPIEAEDAAPDIRVIGVDRMCFMADPVTLEPRSCGSYDAYAFTDPLPGPQMSIAEWSAERARRRNAEMDADRRKQP